MKMYSLHLLDGTILNVRRINPSTFELDSNDSQIYFALNESNLSFALLYKDDMLEDVFLDYVRQNYSYDNGVIRFRIGKRRDNYKKKKKGGSKNGTKSMASS